MTLPLDYIRSINRGCRGLDENLALTGNGFINLGKLHDVDAAKTIEDDGFHGITLGECVFKSVMLNPSGAYNGTF